MKDTDKLLLSKNLTCNPFHPFGEENHIQRGGGERNISDRGLGMPGRTSEGMEN